MHRNRWQHLALATVPRTAIVFLLAGPLTGCCVFDCGAPMPTSPYGPTTVTNYFYASFSTLDAADNSRVSGVQIAILDGPNAGPVCVTGEVAPGHCRSGPLTRFDATATVVATHPGFRRGRATLPQSGGDLSSPFSPSISFALETKR
jgi:hypothetical protein